MPGFKPYTLAVSLPSSELEGGLTALSPMPSTATSDFSVSGDDEASKRRISFLLPTTLSGVRSLCDGFAAFNRAARDGCDEEAESTALCSPTTFGLPQPNRKDVDVNVSDTPPSSPCSASAVGDGGNATVTDETCSRLDVPPHRSCRPAWPRTQARWTPSTRHVCVQNPASPLLRKDGVALSVPSLSDTASGGHTTLSVDEPFAAAVGGAEKQAPLPPFRPTYQDCSSAAVLGRAFTHAPLSVGEPSLAASMSASSGPMTIANASLVLSTAHSPHSLSSSLGTFVDYGDEGTAAARTECPIGDALHSRASSAQSSYPHLLCSASYATGVRHSTVQPACAAAASPRQRSSPRSRTSRTTCGSPVPPLLLRPAAQYTEEYVMAVQEAAKYRWSIRDVLSARTDAMDEDDDDDDSGSDADASSGR